MDVKNPKVNKFILEESRWKEEFIALREIILASGFTEELKWGVPCYTFNNKNIALMHGFKGYCAILFVKGALLIDLEGLLISQTEHVQGSRQIRFTSVKEIMLLAPILKSYLHEAIELEKKGLTVEYKKTSEFAIAQEFQQALDASSALKGAFETLSQGRQRGYLLYFAAPKQSKTRQARIEKCIPQILSGKGLYDR